MTKTLSAAAIASFDSQIKQAYQDGAKLSDTVTTRTGVVGSTHRFANLGKGLATQRISQTDVIPMNLAHTNRTATLVAWNAADYTDIFEQAAVNFDEQSALASAIAKAISRRRDQIIINALEAASSTLTVDNDVGGTDTDLNMDKIRRADRLLGAQGVDADEMRTFVGSYNGKEGLLSATEVTSMDFQPVRALVNGDVKQLINFDFRWIATRSEGGLDLSSNDRTSFAYAKSSMGIAISLDERTEVNYIATKTSWLANGMFQAGAVDIDALGIVELVTREVA